MLSPSLFSDDEQPQYFHKTAGAVQHNAGKVDLNRSYDLFDDVATEERGSTHSSKATEHQLNLSDDLFSESNPDENKPSQSPDIEIIEVKKEECVSDDDGPMLSAREGPRRTLFTTGGNQKSQVTQKTSRKRDKNQMSIADCFKNVKKEEATEVCKEPCIGEAGQASLKSHKLTWRT